jgi:hypothetical protein
MGLFDFFRKRGSQPLRGQREPGPKGAKPLPGVDDSEVDDDDDDDDDDDLEALLARVEQRQRTGPERPLVYSFEHHTLRREVFENHPELLEDLAGDRGDRQFWHAITNAEILCEQNGFVGQAPADEGDPDEGPLDAERRLLERVSIRANRRAGYTVYVLTLPEPKFSPEAHFAAIVHRDGESHEYMTPSPSTRYFTLEKSGESPQALLCEWDAAGSHLNTGTSLAPDQASFTEWVFARILR